ncbi:MAG TPA: cation diffusion facilitator family transporter [Candidatus Binataceae bacterium]|nr:cation diffusion facilitator family transporter [Candidatus Binataceae bacterium]
MESIAAKAQLARDRRRLTLVLAITVIYFATELIAGFYANSLALLTDAVHMLTDLAALSLGLFTLWISSRPATAGKTYGYLRAEILGALFNGLFLWALVAFIWFEAAGRLHRPAAVNGHVMTAVASIGILINGFLAWLTANEASSSGTSMARRAVFLHVVSDLVGSTGLLIAGIITSLSHWQAADPIVSFLIGALIIYGSWGLIREGVDILMESTPAHIDLDDLRTDLLAVAGTQEVHDLHVWCLASHQFALSAHAVVAPGVDHDRVLSDMSARIEQKFNIRHITVQLEGDNRKAQEHDHF